MTLIQELLIVTPPFSDANNDIELRLQKSVYDFKDAARITLYAPNEEKDVSKTINYMISLQV